MFFCTKQFFFPPTFKTSLKISDFHYLYLRVIFFMLFVLGSYFASWISGFIVFIKPEKISAIISLKNVLSPTLLSFKNSSYTYSRPLELSHRSLMLYSFFFLVSSFTVSFWVFCITMSSRSLVFSSAMCNLMLVPSGICFLSQKL